MNKFNTTLNSLQTGDRVVVPKSHLDWVQHHAIFLGYENGHYWFIENKEGIGVRVVKAEVFFDDVLKITRVLPFTPQQGYNRQDLVKFAMKKVGKKYHLTDYNCEHLASEIHHGIAKSKQAETGMIIVIAALFLFIIGGFAIASSNNNNLKKS